MVTSLLYIYIHIYIYSFSLNNIYSDSGFSLMHVQLKRTNKKVKIFYEVFPVYKQDNVEIDQKVQSFESLWLCLQPFSRILHFLFTRIQTRLIFIASSRIKNGVNRLFFLSFFFFFFFFTYLFLTKSALTTSY